MHPSASKQWWWAPLSRHLAIYIFAKILMFKILAVFIPCGLFGPADVVSLHWNKLIWLWCLEDWRLIAFQFFQIQVLRIVQGIAAMFQLNTKDFFGIRGPNATDTSTQSPNSTSPTQAVLTVDGKWSIIDSVYFLFRDSNSFTGCKK